MATLKQEITAIKDGLFLWHQERSILELTELACEIMDQHGISRVELAERLGKKKGHITQLLDGTANMTVRTMSDLFTSLGYAFHPRCTPLSEDHTATTIGRFEVTAESAAETWSPVIAQPQAC